MRVVVLDDYQGIAPALADWPAGSGWSVDFERDRLRSEDAVVERLADDPLLTAPRTVLTPHLGYVTRDNLAHWYTGAVTALHAFAAGAPVDVLE